MKNMIKKTSALALVLVLAMSILSGCKAKTSTAQAGGKTYKLGISAYPAFYTWYICQAEDYFKKNNINVELVYFPVYSDSVQAFSTGQLDMLSVAMPDVIAPYINGIDLESVLVLDNSNGADGLVANSSIKSIKDLKGKSVATEYGTIEHFFLLNALQKEGLTEKDINFVNLSVADSAPAYLSGKVDAACLWEPSLSTALAKEGTNLLISSEKTPGLIPDVLIAKGDMVKNAKDDVAKVINAYYDAMDFYVANQDKAIADMAKGAEISNEEMKVSMSGSKLFTIQEGIDTMDKTASDYSYLPYTTTKIAEFLKSVNMIDKMPDDTKKIVNSAYLKEVLKNRSSKPVPDTKK
jgi:NitT/TauT family transport system substrate-binding protein